MGMMISLRQTEIISLFDTVIDKKFYQSKKETERKKKRICTKFALDFGPLNVFHQFILS